MPPIRKPDRPLIGLTLGDPAGIGPECAFLSLQSPQAPQAVLIAPEKILAHLLTTLRLRIRTHRIEELTSSSLLPGRINYFDPELDFSDIRLKKITPGKPSLDSALLAFRCLEAAVSQALQGRISSLLTGPISKEAIRGAGIRDFTGHTEYLAKRENANNVCMAFLTEKALVGLATTHIALNRASSKLTGTFLREQLALLTGFGNRIYGKKTRTALLAVNPHAGENGLFGDEEVRILAPLLKTLARKGTSVDGPFPADAFWSSRGAWREYNIILAMYHDQGLIPVKSGLLGRSIHLTLGLSYLRLSADHGTAFSLAGRNKADWAPTAWALQNAERLEKTRRQSF